MMNKSKVQPEDACVFDYSYYYESHPLLTWEGVLRIVIVLGKDYAGRSCPTPVKELFFLGVSRLNIASQ